MLDHNRAIIRGSLPIGFWTNASRVQGHGPRHASAVTVGILLLLLAGLVVCPVRVHAVQPAMDAGTAPSGHAFLNGLIDITSTIYATRRAGSRTIKKAMTGMIRSVLKVRGAERQARLIHLLEFQRDLARWSAAMLYLPPSRRLARLHAGTAGRALPALAMAFSHNAARRMAAARQLAPVAGPSTDFIFRRLLYDHNMAVRITGMDALWNRPATPSLVRVLWHRAMVLGPQHPGFPSGPPPSVNFRGHTIHIMIPMMMVSGTGPWWGVQDGPMAAQLLLHWKPLQPVSTRLVVGYLQQICRQAKAQPAMSLLEALQPWQIKLLKRTLVLDPRAVAPYLLYLVHRPLPSRIGNMYFNYALKAHGYFASNRTLPLELLVWAAHQKIRDYHIITYNVQLNGGIPVLAVHGKMEEGRDIQRITQWFAKQGIHTAGPALLKKPSAHRLPQGPSAVTTPRQKKVSNRELHAVMVARANFQQGLINLGSGVYAIRQAGSRKISHAMTALDTVLIQAAGSIHQARVSRLFKYQHTLTRLAIAFMRVPVPQRMAMVRWGFRPRIWRVLLQVFSRRVALRAAAVEALSREPAPNADWVLQRLLMDPSVVVRISAINGLWNHHPTPVMIRAVWRMAMDLSLKNRQPLQASFRGHIYTPSPRPTAPAEYDSSPATQLLRHWQPPAAVISKLIVGYLQQVCSSPAAENPLLNALRMPQSGRHFVQILKVAPPLAAAPYLLYLAQQPAGQSVQFNYHGRPAYFSGRTLPLVCLVIVARQNLTAYHLFCTSRRFYGGEWVIGTAGREDQALRKITGWYTAHHIRAAKPAAASH